MNYAKLENSPRLQRVARVLHRHKRPLTTLDIINKAGICAVNSAISELRGNGIDIKCWRKGSVWYYQEVKGD